jgi:DNA invertase Pin-like site-specific DNA recombinase
VVLDMVTRDERAEKARAMRASGLPLRAIAMHLGCDVATVHRDLAKAA